MRTLSIALLVAAGAAACAPANYAYSFDIADPGARNVTKPGERDVIEDRDTRIELLVDPTSFQAIAFDILNKTDVDLQVNWNNISVITPDHNQMIVRPDAPLGSVPANVMVKSRLVQFVLPGQGPAAAVYDNSHFELIVPMYVRGAPVEKHIKLLAKVKKL